MSSRRPVHVTKQDQTTSDRPSKRAQTDKPTAGPCDTRDQATNRPARHNEPTRQPNHETTTEPRAKRTASRGKRVSREARAEETACRGKREAANRSQGNREPRTHATKPGAEPGIHATKPGARASAGGSGGRSPAGRAWGCTPENTTADPGERFPRAWVGQSVVGDTGIEPVTFPV
jgi:hypothetical protein